VIRRTVINIYEKDDRYFKTGNHLMFQVPLCLLVTNHVYPQDKKLATSSLKLAKRNT